MFYIGLYREDLKNLDLVNLYLVCLNYAPVLKMAPPQESHVYIGLFAHLSHWLMMSYCDH